MRKRRKINRRRRRRRRRRKRIYNDHNNKTMDTNYRKTRYRRINGRRKKN